MNKCINICLALLLMVAAAGCEKDSEQLSVDPRPAWSIDMEDVCEQVPLWKAEKVTVPVGNDPKPSWQAPEAGVFSSSMTAVLRLSDLLATYESNADVMAAFIGDECRGIAKAVDVDGEIYYFLTIKANDTERGNVSLAYYNNQLKTLLKADNVVTYESNKVYGTLETPMIPLFDTSTSFPQSAKIYVHLPESLMSYAKTDDRLAAFDGERCIAVGQMIDPGVFELNFTALRSQGFKYHYFSSSLKYIFYSTVYEFNPDATSTVQRPKVVDLLIDGKHPLIMSMTLTLPDAIDAEASASDIMGAFVGDECRGLARIVHTVYGWTFFIEVRGAMGEEEYIRIKYFNSKHQHIYTSVSQYWFNPAYPVGQESMPAEVDMNI